MDLWKEREVKRKKYDHYNTKLAKLRQQADERANKNVTSNSIFTNANKQH